MEVTRDPSRLAEPTWPWLAVRKRRIGRVLWDFFWRIQRDEACRRNGVILCPDLIQFGSLLVLAMKDEEPMSLCEVLISPPDAFAFFMR